jgi:predicted nucleic acid-binding protein
MKVVVDTNIIFSALVRSESRISRTLFVEEEIEFFIPRIAVVEIFKYKEKILRAAQCEEEVLLEQFHRVLKRLNFVNEDRVSIKNYAAAWKLCKDVDPKDFLFVALTLELEGLLWTGDRVLMRGLTGQGFNQFFVR